MIDLGKKFPELWFFNHDDFEYSKNCYDYNVIWGTGSNLKKVKECFEVIQQNNPSEIPLYTRENKLWGFGIRPRVQTYTDGSCGIMVNCVKKEE